MMFGNAAALAGVRAPVPVPGLPAPGLEPASYVYTGGSAGGVLAASVHRMTSSAQVGVGLFSMSLSGDRPVSSLGLRLSTSSAGASGCDGPTSDGG